MTDTKPTIDTPSSVTPKVRPIFNRHFLYVVLFMSMPFLISIAKYGYRPKPSFPVSKSVSLYSASFSADGRRMIVGANQPESWVQDIPSGQIVRHMPIGIRGAVSVCLSADGKQAIVGELEGKITFWNVDETTLEPVLAFQTPSLEEGHRKSPQYNSRYQAAFSPDKTWAAIKDMHGDVSMWDTKTGSPIRSIDREESLDEIRCVAVSPDGQWLATGRRIKGEVRIFRADTGEKIGSVSHPPRCQAIAFTPDGLRIVTGGTEDYTARVWDTQTLQEIQSFRHSSEITAFAISPNGSMLAVGGYDGSIRVYNLQSGLYIIQFEKSNNTILALQFDPVTSNVRSIDNRGTLQEGDVTTGQCVWFSPGYEKNRRGEIVVLPRQNLKKFSDKSNKQTEELLNKKIQPTAIPLPESMIRKLEGMYVVDQKPLSDVLIDLQKQTGLQYVLNASPSVPISCRISSPYPITILDTILPPQGLNYAVQNNNTILIDGVESLLKNTEAILSPQKLSTLTVDYHSRFKSSMLIYEGTESVAGSIGTAREPEDRQRLSYLTGLSQNRYNTTTLNVYQQIQQGYITGEQLPELIKSASETLYGLTRKVRHIYSIQGVFRKHEVFWITNKTEYHYYLFDGKANYMISPQSPNPVRMGLTNLWLTGDPYRFGSDLDWLLKKGNSIHDVNRQTRQVTLFPPGDGIQESFYVFTLMDGNHAYWTEYSNRYRDIEIGRILCEDFAEFGGMLVPKTVKRENFTIRAELHLVEAKVNQSDFPEDYFKLPTPISNKSVPIGR